jgi:hypothetical protein
MKCRYLFLFLVFWIFTGCEIPQQDDPESLDPPLEGVKLSDLKDDSKSMSTESLMVFRVLTYTIVPDSVDELKEIVDALSLREVRVANKAAFHANGFAIGTSSFEGGGKIAQKLGRMGAVRTAQSRLMFPPDKTEALSRTVLQGTEIIHYSKSSGSAATLTPGQGFLGWVFSAKPDMRFRGMAQIKFFPATWQPGIENIRLAMGEEAVDYQPIHEGQVLARVEEGGVILLGPARSVPDETTLDKLLFFFPGRRPKVQFFVIICDSVGT